MMESTEKVTVRIPKRNMAQIKKHAEKYDGQGNSLNRFILRAITNQIERDTALEAIFEMEKATHYKALHEAQEREIRHMHGYAKE